MKFYVGVTDTDWLRVVRDQGCTEVNFWAPGKHSPVKLSASTLFLFKAKGAPHHIVGGGFFQHQTAIPLWLAWESFGVSNGTLDQGSLIQKITSKRQPDGHNEPLICRILSEAFFLPEEEWISLPNWKNSIVSGRYYDAETEEGAPLLQQLQDALQKQSPPALEGEYIEDGEAPPRYGDLRTYRPRLGQESFRAVVRDAYGRRCALTGEKVLPVLQAAHVRPYAKKHNGKHSVNNGILMKSDLHTLFDRGYLAIDPDDRRIQVSQRIHDEFENGQDYYALHGEPIRDTVCPEQAPSKENLIYHCENIYRG